MLNDLALVWAMITFVSFSSVILTIRVWILERKVRRLEEKAEKK